MLEESWFRRKPRFWNARYASGIAASIEHSCVKSVAGKRHQLGVYILEIGVSGELDMSR